MKNALVVSLMFLSMAVFASGPTISEYEAEVMGLGTAQTEALACTAAKEAALDKFIGYDEQYDNYYGQSYQDEVVMLKSTCSCELSADESEYNCLLEGTVQYLVEEWYN
jgi:hypothetical protein